MWFAQVVAPPARPVYVEWLRETVDLRWERDGWRLDRLDETAGPRPLSLPGTADSAEAVRAIIGDFDPEGT
ncbi:MAG: hypothetical protein LC792_30055 [Actinobacteria bacterium]|nr:hypothetical protein [Actinomycetota bacterium]